jgi:tetratricopeptide (TPR) repeat protein
MSGLALYANHERGVAERRLRDALGVADRIVFVLDRQLEPLAGSAAVRRPLLESSCALLDTLLAQVQREDVLYSRAACHTYRGEVADTHEDPATTARELTAAHAIMTRLAARNPNDLGFQLDYVASAMRVANLPSAGSRQTDPRAVYDTLRVLLERERRRYPTHAYLHVTLSRLHQDIGLFHQRAGLLADARRELDTALSLAVTARTLAGASPEPRYALNVALANDLVGTLASREGRFGDAEQHYRNSLDERRQLLRTAPENVIYRTAVASSYESAASAAASAGAANRAREAYEEAATIREALLRADPGNRDYSLSLASTFASLGSIAFGERRFDDARTAFQRALDLRIAANASPADLYQSHAELAAVAASSGRLDDSKTQFLQALMEAERFARAEPNRATARINVMKTHLSLATLGLASADRPLFEAQLRAADSVLHDLDSRKLLTTDAELADLRRTMDAMRAPGFKLSTQSSATEKGQTIQGDVPTIADSTDPAALVRLARYRAEHGDTVGALAAYDVATRLTPRSLDAPLESSVLRYLTSDFRGAERDAHRAITAAPASALGYYRLGVALLARGDTAGALGAWRDALARPDAGPGHSLVQKGVGDVFAARQNLDAAIQMYGQAVRLSPRNAFAHVSLGWAFWRKRRLADAELEFREAIRIQPSNSLAHNNLGLVLRARGDTVAALAQWTAALDAPDADGAHAFAHSNRGEIAMARRDWVAAAGAYREVVKRQPRNTDALFALGRSLAELRRFPAAIAAFREVVKLDPTNIAARFNIGVALEDSGDIEAAIAAYRTTLGADSTYVLARKNLDRLLRTR